MTDEFDLDGLAIRLAAENGQAWQDLGDYPGYARNIWREEARREVLKLVPDAVIEERPVRWNGRDGGFIVRTAGRVPEFWVQCDPGHGERSDSRLVTAHDEQD